MIRHLVLMKCQPGIPAAQIDNLFAALAALKEKIPGILAFEGGQNNSPEGIARGYTHAFTMDFTDEQARDAYLPHAEHQNVATKIREILDGSPESVLVVDFAMRG
ncbi:stress responsive alpha-beta barrel domain protein [Candidatus Moduliflexus flocculans]|uniref:Stress responsive alpha-beta barrel domain protein n=1 Tax=Candidatus Moduliflexus flocculans TaxID=1499966 RepID=A0A0S6VPM3_9BACT|nr:stress responsive alpha-beta barrel domain protein [Candidatus Moduliflexus flocculans]